MLGRKSWPSLASRAVRTGRACWRPRFFERLVGRIEAQRHLGRTSTGFQTYSRSESHGEEHIAQGDREPAEALQKFEAVTGFSRADAQKELERLRQTATPERLYDLEE